MLYKDEDDNIRCLTCEEVTLIAVKNSNQMSVERDGIHMVQLHVQTIIPKTFCLYKGNSKSLIENPFGVCFGDHSSLFFTDNKTSRLFIPQLHYPVDVTEVLKSLKHEIGVAHTPVASFLLQESTSSTSGYPAHHGN